VVEILAMDAAFNLVGRVLYEPATFEVTSQTIRRNLRGPWVVDDDPFQVNQFGHPYQGGDVPRHRSVEWTELLDVDGLYLRE
jgi:hypothetical protein